MRVIAGRAKGRKLKMRDDLPIRPTSDKVKGAVFNTLAPWLLDSSFLDLFAGSGAMGIEAWSRGASSVTFVEKNRRSFQLLRQNLQLVGFETAECLLSDFRQAAQRLEGRRFDLIYADPPYEAQLYAEILEVVVRHSLLSEDGRLCVEHPRTLSLELTPDWLEHATKTYGDTRVSYLMRREPSGESSLSR